MGSPSHPIKWTRTDTQPLGFPYDLTLISIESEQVALLRLGGDLGHGHAMLEQQRYCDLDRARLRVLAVYGLEVGVVQCRVTVVGRNTAHRCRARTERKRSHVVFLVGHLPNPDICAITALSATLSHRSLALTRAARAQRIGQIASKRRRRYA